MSDSSQPPPGGETVAHPSGGGHGKLIAIVVGGVAAFAATVVTAVVLVNVLGGNEPEKVATEFLEESIAVNVHLDGDPERICELTAAESRETLLSGFEAEDCAEFAEQLEKDLRERRDSAAEQCEGVEDIRRSIAWDVEVTGVEEDEDEATVGYEITYQFDGDVDALEACDGNPDAFDDVEEGELDLLAEDGDWKVAS